jgi:hypothetical protein
MNRSTKQQQHEDTDKNNSKNDDNDAKAEGVDALDLDVDVDAVDHVANLCAVAVAFANEAEFLTNAEQDAALLLIDGSKTAATTANLNNNKNNNDNSNNSTNSSASTSTSPGVVGFAGDGTETGKGTDITEAAVTTHAVTRTAGGIVKQQLLPEEEKTKRIRIRMCRFPGCSRVVKSQGHCQRHGAIPKRCRFAGCDKQAQGTHDGMCKRHWKAIHFPNNAADGGNGKEPQPPPPPPTGESVYDTILPQSIAFRPSTADATAAAAAATVVVAAAATNSVLSNKGGANNATNTDNTKQQETSTCTSADAAAAAAAAHATNSTTEASENSSEHQGVATTMTTATAGDEHMEGHNSALCQQQSKSDPWDVPAPPDGVAVMPLVQFLHHNAHKKVGWHRNQERRARGVFHVSSLSCQLEPWERQLALVEILLLSGGTPYANFKHLRYVCVCDVFVT